MFNITHDEGIEPDERMHDAIARGVALAQKQGYDVQDITFIVKQPKNKPPLGATAQIMEEDRTIAVGVDPDNPNFDLVAQLTVHEINHLEREKHSPIETLEEALVSEGLAQMAEQKAGFAPASISLFESPTDRKTTIDSAISDFQTVVIGRNADPAKDYDYYFKDQSELPDYAGYALGLEMVATYMEGTGTTIQEATTKPASEIANYWKNTL